MKRYPFVPASTGNLALGDLWSVRLKDGGLAVLQVRGLKDAGSGAYTHFVTGVLDWRSDRLPVGHDLRSRAVLAEGLVRFEVFAPGRAEVFGSYDGVVPPAAWSPLAKEFAAGATTDVWSWKSMRRRTTQVLHEAARRTAAAADVPQAARQQAD